MNIDFSQLRLDTSKIKGDFYALETDPKKISDFSHNDLINEWPIERIRRFNASIEFLILSLQRMSVYGTLLAEGHDIVIENDIPIHSAVAHRMACRDACINLEICIEKVQSFCQYYFFMHPKKTDPIDEWAKTFKAYKDIKNWELIDDFLKNCKTLHNNKSMAFIKDVRNAEVHNESPFELIKYHFDPPSIEPVPEGFVVDSQTIHNSIVEAVSLFIPVISSLQKILENITPRHICNYLDPQDGKLKNIIEMRERYIYERERFQSFKTTSL